MANRMGNGLAFSTKARIAASAVCRLQRPRTAIAAARLIEGGLAEAEQRQALELVKRTGTHRQIMRLLDASLETTKGGKTVSGTVTLESEDVQALTGRLGSLKRRVSNVPARGLAILGTGLAGFAGIMAINSTLAYGILGAAMGIVLADLVISRRVFSDINTRIMTQLAEGNLPRDIRHGLQNALETASGDM